YVILFDSTGKKFYENGFVFDQNIQLLNSSNDTVPINKPVSFKVFTTVIPNYVDSVRADFFNADNRKTQVDHTISISGRFAEGTFIPNSLGQFTVVLLGELKDEN